MGFLGDLVDDVLDAGEKIVRAPLRVICAADDHDYQPHTETKVRCSLCGDTKAK